MQRERTTDHDNFRVSGDDSPDAQQLDQHRDEIDGLLAAADRVFDSINSVHAQQYLEQNLQTGGQ